MRPYRFWLWHPDLPKPQMLENDPMGWDENDRGRTRSPIWHGVTYKYLPRLRFIKDGNQFIKYFYSKYYADVKITLYIDKWSDTNRAYVRSFEGPLSIKTLAIKKLYSECSAEMSALVQRLNNSEETNVDISTAGTLSVTMHSQVMFQKYERKSVIPVEEQEHLSGATFIAGHNYLMFPLSQYLTDEIGGREDMPLQVSEDNPVTGLRYQIKVPDDGKYKFNLTIRFFLGNAGIALNYDVAWFIATGRPGAYTTQQVGASIIQNTNALTGELSIVNYEVTLKKDDHIFIYGDAQVNIGGASFSFFVDGLGIGPTLVKIEAETTFPESIGKMVPMHEAWERVVEKITGVPNSFYSEYYGRTENGYAQDGAGSLRGILNGSNLRTLQKATYQSLKSLYTSGVAIDGIGLGVERVGTSERVRVEPLSFFYKAIKIATISNVQEITRTVAEGYYYNEFEAGYDKWNNEKSNNLYEINARREGTLPLESIKQKLVLKADLIAAGCSIEWVRRDVADLTKDNDKDNENFIIQLRRQDGTLVTDKDEDFAVINGILNRSTIYNAKLTPMRNMVRNSARLRGGLIAKDDQFIMVTVAEGNAEFSSRLTTETDLLSEKTIQVSKLSKALWIPEIITFKAPVTEAILNAMDAEPLGFMEFSETESNYQKGFLLDVNPGGRALGRLIDFSLLRANL